MQSVHPISRQMHRVQTSTDTTTRIVTLSPRLTERYHFKHFAKVSIVAAAMIVALLYTAMLIVGVPTINM